MAADTELDSIRQLWAQGAALSSSGQLQEAVLRFLKAKALLQLQLADVEDPICGSERAAAVLNELLSKLQAELSEHISFLKDNAFVALQIDPAACTPAFVRKRYRRLALNYHPDKNPGVDTAALFGVVQSAYEALRDAALYRPLRSYEEFARQQNSRNASNARMHTTASATAKSCTAAKAAEQTAAAANAGLGKAVPTSRSSFSWRVLNEQQLRVLTTPALHELLQCWGFLPPDCSSDSMSRADMLQLYLQSTAQTHTTKEAVPMIPQGIDAADFELFVSTLSSKQVRALLRSEAVDVSDCIEREDYIVRACEAWGFPRNSATAADAAACVRSTAQVPRKHMINLSTERLRAAERKLGRKQQHPSSKHSTDGSNSTEKQSCEHTAASTVEHAATADSAESAEPSAVPAATASAFSYPYMDAEDYSSDSDCSSSSNSSSGSSSHEHSSKHNGAAAGADNSYDDDSDSEAWDWVHTPRGTPTMPEAAVDTAATIAAATPDGSRFVQQLRSQMPEQRQPYAHSGSSAADAAAIQAEVHFWTQQQSTDNSSSAYTQQAAAAAAAAQSDAPAAFWFWGQTAAAAVAAATVASNGG
jgi:curved DNA-binding protein CbpA